MIDVIIPVYNGKEFILKALQSVAAQTLLPASIIVVDDGSTDDTYAILSEYAKESKIKIQIIQQENKGLSAARNIGIKNSIEEFIAFLDADDEWLPSKLEEQVLIFKHSNLENLGIVYCGYELIDKNNNLLKKNTLKIDPSIRGKIFEKILPANKIISSGSGVLIKKECFKKVGYFDESLKACEDWDMWLRLSQEYEFDYSNKILVKIRQHHQNMQKNKDFMLVNLITFYNKWTTLLDTNLIPIEKWRNSILSLIVSNYCYFKKTTEVVMTRLSKESYHIFFGNKKSIYVDLFFFIIKRIFSKIWK